MGERALIFPLVTTLLLVTVLLIFGMKYFAAIRQARIRAGAEEAYRDLAARAVKTQDESTARLAALEDGLADLHARLRSVETLLKDVG